MSVSYSNLTYGGSTSDSTSYTTASISPSSGNNKMVILQVIAGGGSHPTPTISGNNLTWTLINSVGYSNRKIWVFKGIGDSPTSGTISITFSSTEYNCVWVVTEFSDVDTDAPIVQSAVNNGNAISSLTVNLGSFSSTDNATLGCFGHESGSTLLNPGSGFTEIAETGRYDGTNAMMEFKTTNDTSVDASRTSGTGEIGAIALEIKYELAPTTDISKVIGVTQASIKEIIGITNANASKIAGVDNQ